MPRLSLNNLKKAGKVKYNSKISLKDVNRIRESFDRKVWEENSRHYFPTKEFLLFYIWQAYFRMIPRKSFLNLFEEIDNGKLSRSIRRSKVTNKNAKNIHHRIHGGIFGITIGAIVAGIAAAASKAAAAAATTAAVIGSSTAATTVATSVAGGIGGALAGAATEAIIKG